MIPAHVTLSPFVWVTTKLPDSHLYTSQWPGGAQNKLNYQLLPDGSSGADTIGGCATVLQAWFYSTWSNVLGHLLPFQPPLLPHGCSRHPPYCPLNLSHILSHSGLLMFCSPSLMLAEFSKWKYRAISSNRISNKQ